MKITENLAEFGEKLKREIGGNGVLSQSGLKFLKEGVKTLVRDINASATSKLSAIDGIGDIVDFLMKIPPGYVTDASTFIGSLLMQSQSWFWAPVIGSVLMGAGRVNLRRYTSELDRNRDKAERKTLKNIFVDGVLSFGHAEEELEASDDVKFYDKIYPQKRKIYHGFKQAIMFAKMRDVARPPNRTGGHNNAQSRFDTLDGLAARVWLGLRRWERENPETLVKMIPTRTPKDLSGETRPITFESMRDFPTVHGRELMIAALGKMDSDWESRAAWTYDALDDAFDMANIRIEFNKFTRERMEDLKEIQLIKPDTQAVPMLKGAGIGLGAGAVFIGLPVLVLVLSLICSGLLFTGVQKLLTYAALETESMEVCRG